MTSQKATSKPPKGAYRRLVEASADAILVVDVQGMVHFANPAAAQLLARPLEEILGETFGAPSMTDDVVTMHIVRPDGSTAHVETHLAEVEWEDQPAWMCSLRDVTAKHEAEKALRHSEVKYRELVENINDVIFSVDSNGRMLYISPALERQFGYRPQDLEGQHFSRFVHPDDLTDLSESFIRTLAGDSEPFEYRVIDASGDVHHVRSASRVLLEDGQPLGITGVIIDLTDLRRAEKRASEGERQLETLMSNLPGVAYRCRNDAYRTAELLSDGCEKVTGYHPNELVHNSAIPFVELIHPVDRAGVQAEIDSANERGEPFVVEYRIRTRSGDERWLWEKGIGIETPEGEADLLEGFLLDITEQRHTEHQLRQSQKMEAVGQLAGGVAHDFNNLLSIITVYAEAAMEDLRKDDPLHEDLKEIFNAGQRASELTRQLLAFSRRQVLQPAVLDINDVIRKIQKMLGRLLTEDVELETLFQEPLDTVKADPGQLEQVILNLAVNARDAMPSGGLLTIETANVTVEPGLTARRLALEPGPYVQMTVSDTGEGMDETTQERIFEPFFTTKEKAKGTGLGLATVHGIIHQSGGTITVHSEPDRGSTFEIYLPCTQKGATAESTTRHSIIPEPATETILVVEDEDNVRHLTERQLRRTGYKVLSAANGGEALLLCEQHDGPIDLLLTDVVMPRMNGRVLAERLQLIQPKMKVLFMSGYSGETLVQRGTLEAESPILTKPFTIKALRKRVRQALDERRPTTRHPGLPSITPSVGKKSTWS